MSTPPRRRQRLPPLLLLAAVSAAAPLALVVEDDPHAPLPPQHTVRIMGAAASEESFHDVRVIPGAEFVALAQSEAESNSD